MGVMSCGREGCQNIMCDRLVQNGRHESYICGDCWIELLEHKKTWPNEMDVAEVKDRIQEFMNTPIGKHIRLVGNEIDAEFDRLTRNCHTE